MYTMKILEREPALSHFLSAHLPPQWGRALSSAPAGRADLVVVSPTLSRSHPLPPPAGPCWRPVPWPIWRENSPQPGW